MKEIYKEPISGMVNIVNIAAKIVIVIHIWAAIHALKLILHMVAIQVRDFIVQIAYIRALNHAVLKLMPMA